MSGYYTARAVIGPMSITMADQKQTRHGARHGGEVNGDRGRHQGEFRLYTPLACPMISLSSVLSPRDNLIGECGKPIAVSPGQVGGVVASQRLESASSCTLRQGAEQAQRQPEVPQ